ncbi:MAG: hypothetical protein CSB47_09970 [Proteobacteria bacterium]|nr:MAG: hypothetical protein CSB47_09970 [Pseudomonadota bacterium]
MSSHKTVFNLLHSVQRGGIESMFVAYTKLLGQLGYKVICIVPDNFCNKEQLLNIDCIIEHIDIKNYFDVPSAWYLRKLITKYQPSYLISHNGRSHSLINLWQVLFSFKKKNQLQTVGVCHGCMKRMLKLDKIICVNNTLVTQFQQLGYQGTLNSVPCFLSTTINSSTHQLINSSTHQLINSLPKNHSSDFVFGVLGRLSEEKNTGLAVDALAEINLQYPTTKFKLFIAGDGKCKNEIIAKINTHNLQDKVILCGWIKDINQFFNMIDVLLLPSIRESFGCVILEAFQYETPVIASNVDGPSQIIKHNENGLLFESNNLPQLVAEMVKLWTSPDISKRLTISGKESLLTHYTEVAVKQKLQKILTIEDKL